MLICLQKYVALILQLSVPRTHGCMYCVLWDKWLFSFFWGVSFIRFLCVFFFFSISSFVYKTGSHPLDQAVPELVAILLPQSILCWDYKWETTYPALRYLVMTFCVLWKCHWVENGRVEQLHKMLGLPVLASSVPCLRIHVLWGVPSPKSPRNVGELEA